MGCLDCDGQSVILLERGQTDVQHSMGVMLNFVGLSAWCAVPEGGVLGVMPEERRGTVVEWQDMLVVAATRWDPAEQALHRLRYLSAR